jgi:hemerythrin-like domain-containing protein/rubredoxin
MREHRLIERMVGLLDREVKRTREVNDLDPVFIDTAVDFFKTYADRTHHGKEEDILFRELRVKQLKPLDKQVMDELVQEHIYARKTVQALLDAKNRYTKGDRHALVEVQTHLGELIQLYPAHIEKEDRRFFYPAMEYFTPPEQDAMLQEFYEFDRNMIHEKYGAVVEKIIAGTKDYQLMKCRVCGYVYDPIKGDPEHGIEPGVPFEELPDEWLCPVCFAPKKEFEKVT